jgi:AcrR family transcriptional regulator
VGIKYPKTSDRRVQRTRRTLREALLSLILDRGWEAFSVQDVCDRADIGRSTFYTHYADKEDLLVSGFDDFRKDLHEQLAPPPAEAEHVPPFRFARRLIEHAYEYRRLYRALVGKRGAQVVLRKFRELVIDLLREDLAAYGATGPSTETTLHFIAGGLVELLTWSFDTRNSVEAQEAERLFLQMAMPVLDVASGPAQKSGHRSTR